jgi:hypothetical protein
MANEGPPKPTTAEQFHLEQLKALRGEIDECIKYLRQIEVYTVLGNVAVWTFMLTHTPLPSIAVYAWWGPVVLNLFALLKHLTLRIQLESLGSYIERAQQRLPFCDLGWEDSCERREFGRMHSLFNWLFWSALSV